MDLAVDLDHTSNLDHGATSPTQMEFVTSVPAVDLSGDIAGEGVKHRKKGALSSALNNRGYGWLLEVEEDEEELKPIL